MPATCWRCRMRRSSIPRSPRIFPAPTSSPACRWQPKRRRQACCGSCGDRSGDFAAWRGAQASGIQGPENGNWMPMPLMCDLKLTALALAAALGAAAPAFAAEEDTGPRGAAVTVFKAAKSCFGNNVEVSGTIIAREETQVRPERMGLKVADVLV